MADLLGAARDTDVLLQGLHEKYEQVAVEEQAGMADIAHARVRRAGTDVTLATYGNGLPKCLAAAEQLQT